MRTRLIVALVCATLAMLTLRGSGQTSQPANTVDAKVLIKQLITGDPAQRKSAADQLRVVDFKNVPALDEATKGPDLSEEDRAFLKGVADALRPEYARAYLEEWNTQAATWVRNEYLGGYRTLGQRNAKWDSLVEEALS